MVRGLRIMVLGLGVISAITPVAAADQSMADNNPLRTRIKQVRSDMELTQEQLKPLRSQMQRLLVQVEALRKQILPLEAKLRSEHDQMKVLINERGQ